MKDVINSVIGASVDFGSMKMLARFADKTLPKEKKRS